MTAPEPLEFRAASAESAKFVAMGVEEEFHTVDLETRRLMPRADSLLQQLPDERFSSELQRSVVETNSRPFVRIVDLIEDLAALRRGVVAAAEPLGLGVVAAGTVPIVDIEALKVTPDARYENMLEEYQTLAREQLICGAQVHVDVHDRDLAVAVGHRVAPWLPALLALSASSPYWLGHDTGYASHRTLLWHRWPTTGPLPRLESAAEYDAMVDGLVHSGVITDPGMIYYDVRPSAHVPTLELRLCDAIPRVEDVALLASLFRALVVTEIEEIECGRPDLGVSHALLRAMNWRAARAGLEGELVDPVTCEPRPAPRVLRDLLTRLRPALECTDDWAVAQELTEAALARGSSANRQREAFASGGHTEVVDLLLAETKANTEWRPGTGPALTEIRGMLDGYDASEDEAVVFDGSARGPYAMLLAGLDRIGADGLAQRERQRDDVQRHLGMFFQVDEAENGSGGADHDSAQDRDSAQDQDRLLPVDLIPRVVGADDWAWLQDGMIQRVRALEEFLHDAYGAREAVRDGVLPDWAITESPGYDPAGRRVPAHVRRCALAGLDLVRDGAGRWSVLEDNLRVPSGIGYAMANRWLSSRVLPELLRAVRTPTPRRALKMFRTALGSVADSAHARPGAGAAAEFPDRPRLGLVTAGPDDSAFYEHRLLADEMGVPLVRPGDLVVRDGVLYRGDERIDVLYRRIDPEELLTADGADGRPLGPPLLDAIEAGSLVLVNALGNGLGDDKALYSFVPQLITYYLDEAPLLDQVPTFLCRLPEHLEEVLDRLPELVAKPVDGYGGHGVVIGPDASAAELREVRAAIEAEPDRWIAQETVVLSTHPTFVAGRLEPRAVDLRTFVCMGAEPAVVPLALTRAAPAGSRIVNSSQGGGTKDTWLLS